MPTLTPIEGDPFADSLQGDVGAAMQKQQGDEAQRRNVVGQYLQHYTLPQRVMEGIHTETPGVLTEEDAMRFNQLQDEALSWGPHQALHMVGGGLPAAERGAAGMAGGKIKAYHGSPYDFEKFDSSKIGTGEGAQAYGHGLYFAENPVVAGEYKNRLAARGAGGLDEQYAADFLSRMSREEAIKHIQDQLDNSIAMRAYPNSPESVAEARQQHERILNLLRSDWSPPKGKMYEVNIAADPEHFLDWDKPLSEQPEVQKRLTETGHMAAYAGGSGSDVYNIAGSPGSGPPNHAAATEMLRQAGIPGIKYLDRGSRGEGKGTYNYVVFDDKLIDILKKYSMAGLTGTAGLMAAIKTRKAQDQNQ